jgi:septal ring factor EnvC (AmiA/AmiB activator)
VVRPDIPTPAASPFPTRTVACLVALAACVVVAGAQAPARSPASDQARRAADRIRSLRAEADALLAQERNVLAELRRLEAERDARVAEARALDAEVSSVDRERADTESHMAALERTKAEQAPVLRQRLVELYKLGTPGYARLLAGVDDVRDTARAYRAITALAAIDRERARAHASTLASLAGAHADLEARTHSLAGLRQEQERARAQAEAAVRSHAAMVESIDARRDLNAQLTSELVAAQQTLEQQLAATGTSDTVLPIAPFKGQLDWPVTGRLSRRFVGSGTGERKGIEIAAAMTARVAVVHDGTVAFAGPFTGLGNLVIVDHGGNAFSVYGYLDRVDVAKGARVARGQALGEAGTAPSGLDALYFELRIDGRAVDPVQWLKGRP